MCCAAVVAQAQAQVREQAQERRWRSGVVCAEPAEEAPAAGAEPAPVQRAVAERQGELAPRARGAAAPVEAVVPREAAVQPEAGRAQVAVAAVPEAVRETARSEPLGDFPELVPPPGASQKALACTQWR